MNQARNVIRYVNAAHVIDHMFMLIFPAAMLGMTQAFGLDYAGLIGLSLGGFIAFGACSLPAGWLGDHWSRRQMMLLFFFGIGGASILTGLSNSPSMLVIGLTLMGIFAAIYHPVGTAMLVAYAQNRGREIGINGMWGNLGVAFSALITGLLVAQFGWRSAFILPGSVAILLGVGFALQVRDEPAPARAHVPLKGKGGQQISMFLVFGVLALATATGGVVFNATTMTYPKLFQERLHELFTSPQTLGVVVSLAYAFGAVAQLLIGRVLHRFSLKWPFIILTLLQAPLLLAMADSRLGLDRPGCGLHVRGVRPGHGERCHGRQLRCAPVAVASLRLALLPVVRCQCHGDSADCSGGTASGPERPVPGPGRGRGADVCRGAGLSPHPRRSGSGAKRLRSCRAVTILA